MNGGYYEVLCSMLYIMDRYGPGGIRRFFASHPYQGAISFWLLFFILNIPAGVIWLILPLPLLALITVTDAMAGVAGLFIVLALGWWVRVGFATLGNRHDLVLYIVPAAIAISQVLGGITITKPGTIFLFAVFSLVVGLAEEVFFRGLILTALVPAGVQRAVLVSSLLFAIPHLFNAVAGIWDPVFTLADTIAAFGIGVTFAALRIRTGSLWPLIGLHAMIDFTALVALGSLEIPVQSAIQLIITLAFGFLLILYGIFLLRGEQSIPA